MFLRLGAHATCRHHVDIAIEQAFQLLAQLNQVPDLQADTSCWFDEDIDVGVGSKVSPYRGSEGRDA